MGSEMCIRDRPIAYRHRSAQETLSEDVGVVVLAGVAVLARLVWLLKVTTRAIGGGGGGGGGGGVSKAMV